MKLFGSISVRWKIYLIAIVSLIGFAGYLGFNVKVNTSNAQLLAEVRDLHFPILERAKSNRERMDRINEQFNTSVVIAEMDFVDEAVTFADEVFASMDVAIKLNPNDAEELAGIKADFADYLNQVRAISTSMIQGTIDFDELADLAANKEAALAKAIQRQDDYIEFAQQRFNDAIHQANENSATLLQSGFILWVANVLILSATALAIARLILTNIISVSESLEEIATGTGDLDQEIAVKSSDEIGQLAVSFNHLMEKLREKTNDLMSMMQNMHQGLFTVMEKDGEFVIHPEYAAYIEKIFETSNIAGSKYSDLLFSQADIGSNDLDQILTSMSSIIKEDEMMFEFNSHLLPTEIVCRFPDRRKQARGDHSADNSRTKILELDWDPIISNGIVDKMMVTVRDVTQIRAAAKEAEAQKEELDIIGQILNVSPAKFDAFVDNAHDMIGKNKALIDANDNKDLAVVADLFVNMHTIKGNTRTYGLKYITDIVHDAETTYDRLRKEDDFDWNKSLLLEELEAVRTAIERYEGVKQDKLNIDFDVSANLNVVSIAREQYNAIVKDLESLQSSWDIGKAAKPYENMVHSIRKLDTRPLSEIVTPITNSLPNIAQQLDKAPPIVEIHDNELGVKNEHAEVIVNVFTHLLRNSMDHGIETRTERKACGKHAQGRINLDIEPTSAGALITLKDDGRGLALAKIKSKALQGNANALPETYTAQDIANLLFESGVSTANEVSDISGRGVGMDAVRKFLQELGADINIVLEGSPNSEDEYSPFSTQIILPQEMLVA